MADDLASEGYLAIVPEFYHRHAPAGHWLEHDDAGVKEGFSYLHQLTRRHALDDVAACLGWLHAQPGITRTAIVGFSTGGHLAYLAACELPVDRTAVLYGGWLPVTDIPMSQPRPTLDLTPGISGRLLYLVGEDDFLIDAAQREAIARALHDAPGGDGHELVSYPGVAHAFWWPGTPEYDKPECLSGPRPVEFKAGAAQSPREEPGLAADITPEGLVQSRFVCPGAPDPVICRPSRCRPASAGRLARRHHRPGTSRRVLSW